MLGYPTSRRQRLLYQWSIAALVLGLILALLIFTNALSPASKTAEPPSAAEEVTSILSRKNIKVARFQFHPVENSGINFQHFPAIRNSLLPEDMGSGVAWGDYDNDGDPDLFLVNFQGSIVQGESNPQRGMHALYRNDGNNHFSDVTAEAGFTEADFGLGAAWGDYNNDGHLDLYLSNYGANRLYRNNGDLTFTDVTRLAGVGDQLFGASVAWGDYNRDGHIDLYVSNYVQFDYRSTDQIQASQQYQAEIPYTLNPSSYPAAANRLYRNNGDGTFTDVAANAGVANPKGRSLGVIWADFDNDGWPDLYVANDVSANGVYRNLGNGTFTDIGAASLAADYRGAMGLAVADIDQDQDLDLFVTHWLAQENGLFENMISEGLLNQQGERRLFFMDNAEMSGLGQISLKNVGWATGFADFDRDGHPDLWVANGSTLQVPGDNTRLKPQPLHLYQHEPGQGFFEVSAQAMPWLKNALVARGGAQVDFNGDGLMDLAVQVHGAAPLLLQNRSSIQNHWLGLRLRQTGGNLFALGAVVSLHSPNLTQTLQLGGGGSYLSQHSSDLYFGLGSDATIDKLTIRWPDGQEQSYQDINLDQINTIQHQAHYPVTTKNTDQE